MLWSIPKETFLRCLYSLVPPLQLQKARCVYEYTHYKAFWKETDWRCRPLTSYLWPTAFPFPWLVLFEGWGPTLWTTKNQNGLNLEIKNYQRSNFALRSIDNSRGEAQNLERRNVERPIFRNFKITNIEIAKDELFDYFIYEFIFLLFFF